MKQSNQSFQYLKLTQKSKSLIIKKRGYYEYKRRDHKALKVLFLLVESRREISPYLALLDCTRNLKEGDFTAWSKEVKLAVWERQNHCCVVCGQFVPYKKMVLHHEVNRKDGGRSVLENAVGRCRTCESEAHRLFRNGNPTPLQVQEYCNDLAQPAVSD